jgi:carnitine O-acetyltransferase
MSSSVTRHEPIAHRNDRSLPSLPLPSLPSTAHHLSTSLLPFSHSDTETHQLTHQLIQLSSTHSSSLNPLVELSARRGSWLRDLWDQLAYLSYRFELPRWSNVWLRLPDRGGGQGAQAGRAAVLARGTLAFSAAVEEGTALPRQGCTQQIRAMMGTCRRPRVGRDCLVRKAGSSHFVVMFRSEVYRVEVDLKHLPSAALLLLVFESILSGEPSCAAAPPVHLLTALHRDDWAHAYAQLVQDPVNAAIVDSIESALFAVSLDAEAFPRDKRDWAIMYGATRANARWYDKAVTVVVLPDGTAGTVAEHSWGDAAPSVSLVNFLDACERGQGEAGSGMYSLDAVVPDQRMRALASAMCLRQAWRSSPFLVAYLGAKEREVEAQLRSVDVHVLHFGDFGSAALKAARVSPDSFVQVALQVAYHSLHGRVSPQYEAVAMTRYHLGRTETARSVTPETVAFVNRVSRPPSEHPQLLRRAIASHSEVVRRAAAGEGCDRILLGLAAAAREQGLEPPALLSDPVFQRASRWTMSTSHVLTAFAEPAGFPPVYEDGYGVCYGIAEASIAATCTSDATCDKTASAEDMARAIERAMRAMARLL